MRVIVFGATGMIGQGVVIECLEDAAVTEVVVVGRKSCGVNDPKLTEHLLPGRWPELRAPLPKEVAATMVLRLPLAEWSLKVSTGFSEDPDDDLDQPVWAGVVPLSVVLETPVDAPDLAPGLPVPTYVHERRMPR